jgi:dihydroorotase
MANVLPAIQAMAECGVLLLVHGEVTDSEVDMFDREAVFIERKLVSQSSHFLLQLPHAGAQHRCLPV